MRKQTFCIFENKDTDQLRGNREADQRLCLCFILVQSYFINTKVQASSIFCDCTARFVSDQVRNPEDRFSHNEAQLTVSHRVGIVGARPNRLTETVLAGVPDPCFVRNGK